MNSSNTFDFSILLKKWKMILTFAVVGAVVLYCYTAFFAKQTYQCSRAYVINNSISYSNDEASRQASESDLRVSQELVATYKEYINLPQVMSNFSQYISENYNQNISYKYLGSCISIEQRSETGIMQIHVTTSDKYLSNIISDAIDEYLIPASNDDLEYAEIKSVNAAGNGKIEREITKDPLRATILGLIGGAFIGVAISLFLYFISNKITDEDEFAKRFNVPVLANIPDPSSSSKGGYRIEKRS
jgi:capsular polysaccharide biosynthesis protein